MMGAKVSSRCVPVPMCATPPTVKQHQEKETLIAALKVIALGEKDRLQGKGISATDSRAQLLAARQIRK